LEKGRITPCNKENKLVIYTFTGTKINRSLQFLIHLAGYDVYMSDHESSLELYINISDFDELVLKINKVYNEIDKYLELALDENESLLSFSKWGGYLPMKYKCEILKERYFDFELAMDLINNIKLVESN
jgi:ATP-dependent helicase Lhr and Lhr-like helicase